MDTLDDFSTLKQDAELAEPLRRVAYEAGMMLGLEATRDEQAYHRRRLTRHQYWLHGYGTLAGMVVSQSPDSHDNDTDDLTVRLMVSPGIGIDGLGREVLIHETHCINLGEWLAAQTESHLREGYIDGDDLLWLKVYVRQKDCPVAKQPVAARKLNMGTDAVQPSRISDSIRLELIPEPPGDPVSPDALWSGQQVLSEDLPDLSQSEQDYLQQVTDANADAGAQLGLHARLLHALDNGLDSRDLDNQLEDGARLLLAHINISVTDINDITVNPELIEINNLVRPFLMTASQLAWLARQPE